MALVKNDLPILEYDDDPHGLVVPNRNENYHFPRRAVLFFGADAVAEFSKNHGASGLYAGAHVGHEQDAVCQEAGEFVNVTKAHKIYKVQWRGYAVCLSAAPVGAAAAVQLLDFLLACGCDAVIAGGSCGALEPLAEGAFLLPTQALRDEGASYHYQPPARWTHLDEGAVQALEAACAGRGVASRRCRTWSTDGFFRETAAMVEHRRAEGCAAVEMECAGLAACAAFRGARFGQLLYTADSLAGLAHDDRNWGGQAVETALELCLDAVCLL